MWNMLVDGRCLSCNNNNNDEREYIESSIVEIPSFSVSFTLTVSYFKHIIYHSRSRCTSIHAFYAYYWKYWIHCMGWIDCLFCHLPYWNRLWVFMCVCESVCDHSCQIARKYHVRWPDRKVIEKHWCKDNNVFWQEMFFRIVNTMFHVSKYETLWWKNSLPWLI